jgi:DNA (cytosine-5)-methyltransferase 1
MNELALFAGAGGGILGGKLLGWRTVCAVEINSYCRKVLLARQRDGILEPFPIWDDVRTFDGKPWRGKVDVISGGFPCQAFSTAAAGRNCAEDFWPEMRRIVADAAPRYVFAENVAEAAIDFACDDLEQMGYKTRAITVSAADMGGDHIRARSWLAAYTDDGSELFSAIDAEASVREGLRPRVWESEPNEPRMVDGMAHRLDRLKATGNGQVPCVAAAAWNLLRSNVAALSRTD